jgi:hypothetical protein
MDAPNDRVGGSPSVARPRANILRSNGRQRRRFRVSLAGASTCFTVDVSAGGFCVEAMRVMVPGTSVTGTIDADGKSFPFSGSVAWTRASEPRLGLRGRMGVRFASIAEEFRSMVGPR